MKPDYLFHVESELLKEGSRDVIETLLNSFDPVKGIPTELESYFESPDSYFEYYSSTLSTILVAFYHLHILTPELRKTFQDTLFRLRDHTAHRVFKEKKKEDLYAWSVSEGACVFATAWAVWALLETEYYGDRLNEIKEAVIWLTDQQRGDGGFGFDISCESKIFFTSISLHALRLSKIKLKLSVQEINKITRCLKDGMDFILEKKNENDEIVYWTTNISGKNPDVTSTLYALWALYEDDDTKYKELIEKGIKFIRNELKNKPIWEIKQIASEISERYGTHKIIVSFTPSAPLLLLRFGVHSFDELCLKPITWLKNNKTKKGWSLSGYTKGTISFVTALGLWTIYKWEKHATRDIIKENIIGKGGKYVPTYMNTIQGLKMRVKLLILLFFGLIFMILRDHILHFLTMIQGQLNTVSIILTIILAIVTFLGIKLNLISFLKDIDHNYLKGKISNTFSKIWDMIQTIIYGQ